MTFWNLSEMLTKWSLNIYVELLEKRLEEKQTTSTISLEEKNPPLFNLYPNPANKTVRLRFSQLPMGELYAAIYDMSGQLLKNFIMEKHDIAKHEKIVDVSDLTEGIYIVKFSSSNFEKSMKLSISR